MELRYLEWNLHGMGGKDYTIPEFVANYALEKNVDIMVFVEFCFGSNWDIFKSALEKKHYDLYISPYVSGHNQICIALRHGVFQVLGISTENAIDVCKPEFLQIDTSIEGKKLTIVGARIKTESNTKPAQYNFLRNHLNNLPTVFCTGDFNSLFNNLVTVMNGLDVFGPRVTEGYYSFVFRNGDVGELDWVIAKGVDVWNPYLDKGRSPYVTCDWGFVAEDNGYGGKTALDYLGIRGLPDHAVLMGAISI